MPTGIYIRTEKHHKALLGRKNGGGWNKGEEMPRTEEWQRNLAEALPKNEKHYAWKGDEVGYRGVHMWVVKNYGKAFYCSNKSNHKSPRYHWANISGEYKRDISDWRQLCPTCNYTDGIKINERFLRGGVSYSTSSL